MVSAASSRWNGVATISEILATSRPVVLVDQLLTTLKWHNSTEENVQSDKAFNVVFSAWVEYTVTFLVWTRGRMKVICRNFSFILRPYLLKSCFSDYFYNKMGWSVCKKKKKKPASFSINTLTAALHVHRDVKATCIEIIYTK